MMKIPLSLFVALTVATSAAAQDGPHDHALDSAHVHSDLEAWLSDLDLRVGAVKEALGPEVAATEPEPTPDPSTACSPTVTWDPGNETLQRAYKRLPGKARTKSGVIGIPEGAHATRGLWMTTGGEITVCGLGAKPVLTLNGSISLNNGRNANWGVGGSLTIENLRLTGKGEIVLAGGKVAALTVRDVYQHDCRNNGIHTSLQPDYEQPLQVLLDDYRVERCGQGNTKHNVYISTRNASVVARRVTSCGSNGSHAFKSIARELLIEDSRFDTWCPGDRDGPWSTTLVDVAACAQTTIRNTRFISDHVRGGRGSANTLQYKARRGIHSCDLPVFSAVGDPKTDFTNRAFWAAPAPAAFRHEVIDSEFVSLSGTNVAIRNDGTYPRTFVKPFRAPSVFKKVIPEWFERAETHVTNVTFTGYDPAKRFDMTNHEPVDATSDPGATIPPPPRKVTVDGVAQ
jgi:hypothetical protein